MRRPKRRREGEIVRVELGDAHGWTAPFVYGKGDLPRALRIEAECDAQAVEFRRRREIDVQLSRFGDDLDPRDAAGEFVVDVRRPCRNRAPVRIHSRPEQFHGSALDGPGRQIIAACAIRGGSGALRLYAHRGGERKSDRREGRREPQHGQERAAADRWGGPPGLPSSQRSFPTARKAGGPTNGVDTPARPTDSW